MLRFSSVSKKVVEDFAAHMGIAAQTPADNAYVFEFSASGILSLAPSDDANRILVCLSPNAFTSAAVSAEAFLQLAGPDPETGLMLHVGVGEEGALALIIGIEEGEFTTQFLDQAVALLLRTAATLADLPA